MSPTHTHLETARLRRPVVAIAAAVAPVLAAFASAPAAADPAPVESAWTQVFKDDFEGPAGSLPSAQNWIFDTGHGYPGGPDNWGTGEIQSYTKDPANISLDGSGNLKITPTTDGSGNWYSARIETQRADFRPPSGGELKIEARLQLPGGGQGYWPAFWALGAPYRGNYWNWPGVGEMDIMENVNNQSVTHGVLHCGVSPGGPCNETTGLGAQYELGAPGGSAGFHTYTVIWDTAPQEIRWYVDGNQYHSVTPSDIGQDTWNKAFSHGYFILLNVAIGGGWAGPPDSSTVPGEPMVVDYVAVHSTG